MADDPTEMPETRVVAYQTEDRYYPEKAPFHPDETFPEYSFDETANERNPAYEAVRSTLRKANLDVERIGTAAWNPLGDLVKSDDTVLVKPNFIKEEHPHDPDGWRYVLTHGSIIRAVCDYLFLALGEDGRVVIADAPHTDSSFAAIADRLQVDEVRDFYVDRGHDCSLVDLRQSEWKSDDGVVLDRYDLDGDPYGYTEFNLGYASEFADHEGQGNYYGADYDTEQVNEHHNGGNHEYLIASSPIEADVVFNLPKVKTHKKAGVTLSLKNLVGINGDKNYLPHHTRGGDEHPDPNVSHRFERWMVSKAQDFMLAFPGIGPRLFRKVKPIGKVIFGGTEDVIRNGNWHGNDTVWRMCLDLNKLLYYGSIDGSLNQEGYENRKRHYSLCDGIIAGEGRGPMNPDPASAGLLVFGTNPVAVDLVTSWLMGFDPEKIPIIRNAFKCEQYPLADFDPGTIAVTSNRDDWCGTCIDIPTSATLEFDPHFGWEDHVEIE